MTRVLEEAGFPLSRVTILDAATVDDVLRVLADRPYSLIHFSGHGECDGILVEGDDPEAGELTSIPRIEQVLQAAQPYAKLAVFLSCFSASFADRLIAHVPYILAIVGPADDERCIQFVNCFYSRLLRGDDPERAHSTASRRVAELNAILLRRADRDGKSTALVRSHTYEVHPTLYIDVSRAAGDLERFGMTKEDLLKLMSRKIYFHAWAFRYPRSNAILSVGDLFASFSWDNAEDCISCDRLSRLREDAPADLAQAFVELLISYSDRYVANYRSPIAPHGPDYAEQVSLGIMKMLETYGYFFSKVAEPTSEMSSYSFEPRPRPSWADVFGEYVPAAFRNSKAIGSANLATAERKFRAKELAGCVAHLEAALSSLHDLMNEVEKRILE